MNEYQEYQLLPGIFTPKDLGIYYLGSPDTAIVPPKCPVDRAEYGRRLAEAEGGIFTSRGYMMPLDGRRRSNHVA